MTISMETICMVKIPNQNRTNQNAQISPKTTLPYNKFLAGLNFTVRIPDHVT